MSFNRIPRSSGSVKGMFVQNSRLRDCAETKEALNITGSTPISRVMISLSFFGMEATFSNTNHLGLHSFFNLTYCQNRPDLSPSSPLRSFFAMERSWHGDPPISKSISPSTERLTTLPTRMMSG